MGHPSPSASATDFAPGSSPGAAGVPRPGGGRTAAKVIGGLLLGSTIVSIIAYVQFTRSETGILKDLEAIHQKGATIAVDACVAEVIDWHAHKCQAMSELCDRSVGRMMEQCLAARDRSDYCATIDPSEFATPNFGHADCEARAKNNRKAKKQCGTAYRAIAYYCGEVQKRLAGAPPAPVEAAR